MAKSQRQRGDSNEVQQRAVRAIYLAAPDQGQPRPYDDAQFPRDLQLHFVRALSGLQWKHLPIEKDQYGRREIHPTSICRIFMRWQAELCFDAIFEGSVLKLHQDNSLDQTVMHGDGTTTAAKKGGDNIGFSGHKKLKGDKAVIFCDRGCNVIAPLVAAAGNRNESPLLRQALPHLTKIAHAVGLDLQGSIVSLDGVYDCPLNRQAIFNRGMVPNIPENPRGRKTRKRGRKQRFDPAIFEESFRTIERLFAWEDKFS